MSTRRSLTFSRRNLLGVAASMALLIGLAGCTTPSPSPTGVTTVSPKPTPAASVPHPIISVSCDQLLPMKTVQSAVTSPLTARVTEATPPASLADASYRQAGGFDCEWTASTASAGQPDGVSLIVLPDALDALTSF